MIYAITNETTDRFLLELAQLVPQCTSQEGIQEKIVKPIIQRVKSLETDLFTNPNVREKICALYKKIKEQPALATLAPLTKAITETIITDMSSEGYSYPEWLSTTSPCYLTFTDPQYVQTEIILTSKNCILFAKKFFYAHRDTGNEGYQEIAKKAFQKASSLKPLFESHLACFVDTLRRGSNEEKCLAKKLLEIQEGDTGNRRDMKRLLLADILYRDENNPQKAVEDIRAVLKTCRYCEDVWHYASLELYYLFKIQPLPVDDIKRSIREFLPEESLPGFYYTYLLDLQTDVDRMPTLKALEKFTSTAYSLRLSDEFCSNPWDMLAIRLLKELPTEVQKLVYKDSEKW
jgi:hypothetical protein